MPSEVLAPLASLAVVLIFMLAAVQLVGAIRRASYRAFEDASEKQVACKYSIPGIAQSPAEDRRRALSPFLRVVHERANAAQSRYHHAVAGSAGCLVIGFIAMVAGTLPKIEWPAWAGNGYELVEYILTWIDVIAIVMMLLLFLYGRFASRRWLVSRVVVELLRQYQFVSAVMPNCACSGSSIDDVISQYAREAQTIKKQVENGLSATIISRIAEFWSERRAAIESRMPTANDLAADAVLIYAQRRARRQLVWFTDSKARLESVAGRRFVILLSLYGIAAVLAVVKLFVVLYNGTFGDEAVADYLLRLLLIVTGISAAMTAYYVNTNARSLSHRYNTQQRRAAEWLESFNKQWPFRDLISCDLNDIDKIEIRSRILQFEELMIDELIDWLHITSHDAMELAP